MYVAADSPCGKCIPSAAYLYDCRVWSSVSSACFARLKPNLIIRTREVDATDFWSCLMIDGLEISRRLTVWIFDLLTSERPTRVRSTTVTSGLVTGAAVHSWGRLAQRANNVEPRSMSVDRVEMILRRVCCKIEFLM